MTPAVEPTGTKRISVIDGIRGHLLLGMMVAHISFLEPSKIALLHHQAIIAIWDGEFFVLISGFLVGLLSEKGLGTSGLLRRFLLRRSIKLYGYILICSLLALLMEGAGDGTITEILFGTVTLSRGSVYSSLLAMYLTFFLLLIAFSAITNRTIIFLFLSASLYALSLIDDQIGFFGLAALGNIHFDFAAWQFLFFIGFASGLHRSVISHVALGPPSRNGFYFLILAALLLVMARYYSPQPEFLEVGFSSERWKARNQMEPAYLVDVLAVSIALAILIFSAFSPTFFRNVLQSYFRLRPLQALGRCALPVFVWHVFLITVYEIYIPESLRSSSNIPAVIMLGAFFCGPYVSRFPSWLLRKIMFRSRWASRMSRG